MPPDSRRTFDAHEPERQPSGPKKRDDARDFVAARRARRRQCRQARERTRPAIALPPAMAKDFDTF